MWDKARIISNVPNKAMLCLNPMYTKLLALVAMVNHSCVVVNLNQNRNKINKSDETPSSSMTKRAIIWEPSKVKTLVGILVVQGKFETKFYVSKGL